MTNLTCEALINPGYAPASQEMVVPGNQNVLARFDGNVAAPIIVAEVARVAGERRQDFFDPGGDAGRRANLYFALIS